MKTNRPFIVIESLDAAGGSTQLTYLKRHLKREGFHPHTYHFPQEDHATGRFIYDKFLLHQNKHPFSKREQALLFILDFYSKLDEMKLKQEKGKQKELIVSDRYCTSTMAYQTIGMTGKERSKMLEWLNWICWQHTPALLKPDRVILLDLPVEISIDRLNKSGTKKDYFENKRKLGAIRRSYLKLAQEQRWSVIAGTDKEGNARTRKDIHNELWNSIERLLQ